MPNIVCTNPSHTLLLFFNTIFYKIMMIKLKYEKSENLLNKTICLIFKETSIQAFTLPKTLWQWSMYHIVILLFTTSKILLLNWRYFCCIFQFMIFHRFSTVQYSYRSHNFLICAAYWKIDVKDDKCNMFLIMF